MFYKSGITKRTRADLALDQHGHVHEHLVQFTNTWLKFHDVIVSCLNVLQWLPSLLRLRNYLLTHAPLQPQCKRIQ